MPYVLTNGHHCLYINGRGEIKGGTLQQAKRFMSEETASMFLSAAPERFKIYCVVPATKSEVRRIRQIKDAEHSPKQSYTSQNNKRCLIDPIIRRYIYKQANGKCDLCGKPVKYIDFTIDHIVPLSMGGENDVDNFQCTCRACNQFKSNILPEDFIQRVSDIFLYQTERRCKSKFKWKLFNKALQMVREAV